MTNSIKLLLASAASCAFLAACGGGGGSSSTTAPPPTTVTPPTTPVSGAPDIPDYESNVFPPSSSLRAICETVRTDTDLNGNPRPDTQGELLHELFWLRSFMNETYLFFDQVADRDPNDFTDRGAYFDDRLTTATTASGRLVDRFSFLQTTESSEATRSGAPVFGYGASFARIQTNVLPRDWRVSFTQEGSNADVAGFNRGARILTVDGADFLNGTSQADIDAINGGLFPDTIGEEHVFGVRLPDGTETDITVAAQSITIEPVNAVEIIENGDDSVGYIHYTSFGPFTGEEQLFDAFTELSEADVDDLVLDFRYNGGGLLALAAQIGYMAADDDSDDEIFYLQEFNSRNPNVNPISGAPVSPIPFIPESLGFLDSFPAGQDLPNLDLPRVFFLTTSQSCSASEAVMNGLLGIGVEVIQIGTRTCGKATGQIPLDNCGITYTPLHFRGVNATGFGDFDDGFAPGEIFDGCEVDDDFSAPLGDPSEAMLSAALTFASTGSCPSAATAAAIASKDVNGPLSSKNLGLSIADPLMEDPRMKAFLAQETVLNLKGTSLEAGGK